MPFEGAVCFSLLNKIATTYQKKDLVDETRLNL